MLTLVYKHGVGRHFDIIKYPDGQQNVKLDMGYFNDPKQPVTIECSVRNFMELDVLLSLVAALRKNDFHVSHIDFKFLFGMRSDRAFEPGMPNYFRDVIAPILNNLEIRCSFLYPHSLLGTSSVKRGSPYEKNIDCEHDCFTINADTSFGWHSLHFNDYTLHSHFSKKREDGHVRVHLREDFHAAILQAPQYKPLLIMDDLCDGGATFIAISEYLESHFSDRLRYLFVAHGLFTKGVDHVAAHFDKVITTNSFQEFEAHPKLEIIDVWK